ncbi:hypothetical protein FDB41_11825 [Clostridium botulinum]|nr:hypothetical protein [Clostridium botulinum]NFO54218.1 hypothetical protein [Clostridium botulinum]
MLKAYLITAILFYLSFTLCIMRYLVNKEKIVLKHSTEKWFVFIRFLIMGFIPIFNIIFAMLYIYISVFAESEKFIEFMSEQS